LAKADWQAPESEFDDSWPAICEIADLAQRKTPPQWPPTARLLYP